MDTGSSAEGIKPREMSRGKQAVLLSVLPA